MGSLGESRRRNVEGARRVGSRLRSIRAPIIHHQKLAPVALAELRKRPLVLSRTCPHELSILTCKNYPEPSVLEQSLRLLGIDGYHVIERPAAERWVNLHRARWIGDFIRSGRCETPYLLVSDASDVVVRGDLGRVLEVFLKRRCRALFMSTSYDGGYACMPEQKAWVGRRRYLNAGVYIGETAYILSLVDRLCEYITEAPMPKPRFRELGRGRSEDRRLCDELPFFPYGLGSDQIVLRYLEPTLFPDVQVDCDNEIAFRNGGLPAR